jgi:hypothetical protein
MLAPFTSSHGIVNGVYSSSINDAFDSVVLITFETKTPYWDGQKIVKDTNYTQCTGSIMNDTTVLTAAHCVQDLIYAENYTVKVFGHDKNDQPRVINMEKFFIHPDFLKADAFILNKHLENIKWQAALIRTPELSQIDKKNQLKSKLNELINYYDDVRMVYTPVDVAVIKVATSIDKNNNFSTFHHAWIEPQSPTDASEVTLAGYGLTTIELAQKDKTKLDGKLRMGKNKVAYAEQDYIRINGTSRNDDGWSWNRIVTTSFLAKNWNLIEPRIDWNSLGTWGDSGGPLAKAGTYGKGIYGTLSVINIVDSMIHLTDEEFVRSANFYTNLNSPIVRSFLNKHL